MKSQRSLIWFKNRRRRRRRRRRRWWKWLKIKRWFISGVWNGFKKMGISECWITVTRWL